VKQDPFPEYFHLRLLQQQGDHGAVLDACGDLDLRGYPNLQLLKGISLILSGNADDGRDLLNIEPVPSTTAERSDLGLARLLSGQPRQAYEILSEAVTAPDADAVVFGRLAAVYLSLGDLEQARIHYQEAVDREPGRAEWHNNLAGILVRQQKLEQALENYDLSLSLKPDLAQSVHARQRILIALARTEEVVTQLEQDLQKDPENGELILRLARALTQDNRPTEALALLHKTLKPLDQVKKPEEPVRPGQTPSEIQRKWKDQVNFRVLVADIFTERAMHLRALAVINQILQMEPEHPVPFLGRKVHALTELGRYDRAEQLLDEAQAEHPDANSLKVSRAALYCEAGRYEEAEALQRELLAVYPGDAGLKSHLAQTLLWTGKLDEAADLFEEASRQNPMALPQMVNAKRLPGDPAALNKMAAVADNPLVPDMSRISMGFALAQVYDKRKEIDRAWHYLALANELTEKGLHYSADAFTQKVNALIDIYSQKFFDRQAPIRTSDRTPVFVVGMPRSGTTLTEQILCSHPQIFGAGELDLMARLTRLMPKVLNSRTPYPRCMDRITPHLREEAARFYLHGLFQYDREHPYVVDKMPHNFEKLGLIALIFPRARIIHVRRDPRDTALSNLQQNFKARHGGLGYAFDQVKTARQINDYHRLMAHWRRVLPLPMCEFFYEDLVADQDHWSRMLLEFVGVDWDDKVHDFHKTERAVRTASVSQVRQPIYQTSRQKWRRYETYLKPLLDTLDPDVTAPWS
jgi:tetratricopeptide (TPR) repeat protein